MTVPPPLHSNLQSLLGIANKSLDTYTIFLFYLCSLKISWFQSIEMEALLIVLLPILVYSAIAAVFFGLLYLLNWVLCPPNEEKDVEGTRPDINRSEYSGNLIC